MLVICYLMPLLITEYLRDIAEILLFLLLPEDDFHCKTLRFLVRELFVEVIILPLLDLFSDPDYINQTIIWLVSINSVSVVRIILIIYFNY